MEEKTKIEATSLCHKNKKAGPSKNPQDEIRDILHDWKNDYAKDYDSMISDVAKEYLVNQGIISLNGLEFDDGLCYRKQKTFDTRFDYAYFTDAFAIAISNCHLADDDVDILNDISLEFDVVKENELRKEGVSEEGITKIMEIVNDLMVLYDNAATFSESLREYEDKIDSIMHCSTF